MKIEKYCESFEFWNIPSSRFTEWRKRKYAKFLDKARKEMTLASKKKHCEREGEDLEYLKEKFQRECKLPSRADYVIGLVFLLMISLVPFFPFTGDLITVLLFDKLYTASPIGAKLLVSAIIFIAINLFTGICCYIDFIKNLRLAAECEVMLELL